MTLRHRDMLENAIGAAVVIAVALVALYPAWLQGKVPLSTDHIRTLPPWHDPAQVDPAPASDVLSVPAATRYYPWFAFLSDAVRRGDSVLWNPLEGAGTPFMAVWRTRVYSPFTIPFYFLPLASAFAVSAVLKLVAAGLCAFYAARRLGLVAPLALAVAVGFELCGLIYVRSTAPISDVLPWLPLVILFGEQIAAEHWGLWPFGSLIWALMLFGGDPETVTASALLLAIFLAIRLLLGRARPGEIGGTALALALSMVFGTALAAIQLLPYVELTRQASALGKVELHAPLAWTDAAVFFFPRMVSATASLTGEAPAAARAVVLPLLHVGMVPLVFVPLWFSVRTYAAPLQRERMDALLLSALVMTMLGLAAGYAGPDMPVLGWFNTEHFFLANAFALAVVSAVAAQHWLALNAKEALTTLPRFLKILAVLLVLAIALYVGAAVADRPGVDPGWRSAVLAVLFVAAGLALLAVTLVRPSVDVMGYGLAVVVAANMLISSSGHIPYRALGRLFPETSFVGALEATGKRITGSPTLQDWPLSGNGIPQFYSASGVELTRHTAFAERLREAPELVRRTGTSAVLLTRDDIQGPFAELRPSLKIAQVFESGAVLFEDLEALPRARMVYGGRVSTPADGAPVDPDLPPLMETVVETVSALTEPEEAMGGTVEIEAEANGYLRLRVSSATPGVLVLADAYYPGWTALVDQGEEAEVFPVDRLFRGVALREGTHTVEFHYDPTLLRAGLIVSIAAAVLVAAALAAKVYARQMPGPV